MLVQQAVSSTWPVRSRIFPIHRRGSRDIAIRLCNWLLKPAWGDSRRDLEYVTCQRSCGRGYKTERFEHSNV